MRPNTARMVSSPTAGLFLAAVFLLPLAGCGNPAQPSPDVWANVNGTDIKREAVDKYYRTRVSPEGQEPSQEESLSLKLNILDELINNEILLERAKKLNLVASDGEVEDKFTEMKSPYTEDEFQRQLKERGITVDDLKTNLRRQQSITKLMNREVVAKISISDQDIADFYASNKQQFNVAEPQYRVAQIVVTPRKEPVVRNRKNDDATNEAEVSRTVQLKDGVRILKLVAREAPGQRGIGDPQVQQTIRDTLKNRKEQLLKAAYLATVRDEAKVTNYLARQVIEAAGRLPEAAKTSF